MLWIFLFCPVALICGGNHILQVVDDAIMLLYLREDP